MYIYIYAHDKMPNIVSRQINAECRLKVKYHYTTMRMDKSKWLTVQGVEKIKHIEISYPVDSNIK